MEVILKSEHRCDQCGFAVVYIDLGPVIYAAEVKAQLDCRTIALERHYCRRWPDYDVTGSDPVEPPTLPAVVPSRRPYLPVR